LLNQRYFLNAAVAFVQFRYTLLSNLFVAKVSYLYTVLSFPPPHNMPVIPINYIAVLLASVASMVIGFLWFGPLFGTQWMALSGIKMPTKAEMKQMNMSKNYALAFLGALVFSFVMAHSLVFASEYLGVYGVSAGLQAGFWNWLGFVVPVLLATVNWEGKPWKLFAIHASYYLVQFLVVGVILALMPAV